MFSLKLATESAVYFPLKHIRIPSFRKKLLQDRRKDVKLRASSILTTANNVA